MRNLLALFALAGPALAQSSAWGQCGGKGWTGATTCVSGYTCTYQNDYYSQCLAGSDKSSTTLSTVTKSATSTSSTKASATSTKTSATATATGGSSTSQWWFGVNEAGGEFGEGTLPGTWGVNYIFPDTSVIDTLIGQGYNTFRVGFRMERLTTSSLTGSLNEAYLKNLTAVVNHITDGGAWAVLDPHNYGRYFGNIITDTAAFQTWWKNVATQFKSNDHVIFDTNNEYNGMDQTLVLNLNQAAINGIRAAGATSQYIFVEGNQWSGAWSWTDVNTNMKALTDTQGKIVYEMHQYLDSDSSGTSSTCVSTTIGVERVTKATEWLRENGKVGIIGEFAGGANTQCQTAVKGLLDYLKANDDVWMGALWWAGGPWWSDYIFSFEPPSGTGYSYYNSLLKTYA
ncbi:glycoside hydrolase superfamily [Thelonectria olida]|uniref:cellulase n=1 Tax=Thelonectria olida TaxID=1576542 RepID=A0A9P9AQN4_9HYPO|nr:glycoside hydrolase superfamily [Thelonectria olida]